MKVVFDVDGVLTDFVAGFTNLLAACAVELKAPPFVPHTNAEQQSWDFDAQPDVLALAWQIVRDTYFWQKLKPLIGLREFYLINELRADYDVYFLTSRPGKRAKQQTERWLKNYGVNNPTVIVVSSPTDKLDVLSGLDPVDFLIEDHPQLIVRVDELKLVNNLFVRLWPYNEEVKLSDRVVGVTSVESFIEAIKRGGRKDA